MSELTNELNGNEIVREKSPQINKTSLSEEGTPQNSPSSGSLDNTGSKSSFSYTDKDKIVKEGYLIRHSKFKYLIFLALKKSILGQNLWTRFYFRLRKENNGICFVDWYNNDKGTKPLGSIPLSGAHIISYPNSTSQKLYKRNFIIEIQEPTRKWKLEATNYDEKLSWYNYLAEHSILFIGKTLSSDSSMPRNSPKDNIYNNLFDAVNFFFLLNFSLYTLQGSIQSR